MASSNLEKARDPKIRPNEGMDISGHIVVKAPRPVMS